MAEYRPKFVLWTSFLAQLPLQVFFACWGGLFFGGIIGSFSRPLRGSGPSLMFEIGLAIFFIFPIITLTIRFLNYKNTAYRLSDRYLFVKEGFLTIRQKEIQIVSIREVSLRRGVLQRLVGLGSIYLATQATGQGIAWQTSALLGAGSTFGSGAMLMDLAAWEEAYQELRKTVEDSTR